MPKKKKEVAPEEASKPVEKVTRVVKPWVQQKNELLYKLFFGSYSDDIFASINSVLERKIPLEKHETEDKSNFETLMQLITGNQLRTGLPLIDNTNITIARQNIIAFQKMIKLSELKLGTEEKLSPAISLYFIIQQNPNFQKIYEALVKLKGFLEKPAAPVPKPFTDPKNLAVETKNEAEEGEDEDEDEEKSQTEVKDSKDKLVVVAEQKKDRKTVVIVPSPDEERWSTAAKTRLSSELDKKFFKPLAVIVPVTSKSITDDVKKYIINLEQQLPAWFQILRDNTKLAKISIEEWNQAIKYFELIKEYLDNKAFSSTDRMNLRSLIQPIMKDFKKYFGLEERHTLDDILFKLNTELRKAAAAKAVFTKINERQGVEKKALDHFETKYKIAAPLTFSPSNPAEIDYRDLLAKEEIGLLTRIDRGIDLQDETIDNFRKHMLNKITQGQWKARYGGGVTISGLNVDPKTRESQPVPDLIAEMYLAFKEPPQNNEETMALLTKMVEFSILAAEKSDSRGLFFKRNSETCKFYREYHQDFQQIVNTLHLLNARSEFQKFADDTKMKKFYNATKDFHSKLTDIKLTKK